MHVQFCSLDTSKFFQLKNHFFLCNPWIRTVCSASASDGDGGSVKSFPSEDALSPHREVCMTPCNTPDRRASPVGMVFPIPKASKAVRNVNNNDSYDADISSDDESAFSITAHFRGSAGKSPRRSPGLTLTPRKSRRHQIHHRREVSTMFFESSDIDRGYIASPESGGSCVAGTDTRGNKGVPSPRSLC